MRSTELTPKSYRAATTQAHNSIVHVFVLLLVIENEEDDEDETGVLQVTLFSRPDA
jgi:hypothetical protein